MGLKIELFESAELKKAIQECIRGEFKSMVREQVDKIIADEVREKVSKLTISVSPRQIELAAENTFAKLLGAGWLDANQKFLHEAIDTT